MEITRRTALLGAAGGLFGGLPVAASPSPVPLRPILPPQVSPFLPAQWGPVGYMMQFREADRSSVINLDIRAVTNGYAVATIDEAENAYLANSHVADEVWDASKSHQYIHQPFTRGFWMACALRRQAAYVAYRGRRGYANIALMHPDMIEQIGGENLVDPAHFEGVGTVIGRWTRTAELPKWGNVGSTIYCSPHIAPDEAFVLYQAGFCDAGGILLNEDGRHKLIMQDVTAMTGPHQYVTRVRFSERKADSG